MPELSRFAFECRRASRTRARLYHRSIHEPLRRRSSTQDRSVEIQGHASNHRSRSFARDPTATALHGRGWTRLSRARAFGKNIKRRRIAANSVGRATWVELARGALRV